MITKVKTKNEIERMRQGGKILAQILKLVQENTKAGMSTKDLADIATQELKKYNYAKPAFLGYYGFPDVLCVSVNDEVIHGIPRVTKILSNGDIVSIDFGVDYKGMITDAARTFVVGKTNSSNRLLIAKTEEALMAGITVVKNTATTNDIAAAIEHVLVKANLGIVREFVGHGVGHELHEEPNVPNYVQDKKAFSLQAGMTIAIEPMATLGSEQVYINDDEWTVSTKAGVNAAHFEDTVLVTEQGFEVLTRNGE